MTRAVVHVRLAGEGGDRLGDVERALVERRADDGARPGGARRPPRRRAPAGRRACRRRPTRSRRGRCAASDLGEPAGVGPAIEALDLDLGDHDRAAPASASRASASSHSTPGSLAPSRARPPRGRARRARAPPAGERRGGDEVGVLERRGADDHAGHAGVGQRGGRLVVRTPPPVCTGTPTAAAMAAMTVRLTGSPVRAASRSTTWIHGAPAAANAWATATGSSP